MPIILVEVMRFSTWVEYAHLPVINVKLEYSNGRTDMDGYEPGRTAANDYGR
jgi:hypothetical protein